MKEKLQPGKLDEPALRRLLRLHGASDPRVVVGARFGEDAAVIDLGAGQYLVLASDPITFAARKIGWYAVHVNANDLAAIGADPVWLTLTVLLPEGCPADLPEQIMSEASAAAASLSMAIVGGHTEVTPGLDRPLLIGTAAGLARRDQLRPSGAARPSDKLLLCGYACLEGTALLALEYPTRAASVLGEEAAARAADFLYQPGISVVRYARAARSFAGVHAMHDPTEGGVVTGSYEMAVASGCGLMLDADRVPLLPETRTLCEALNVDPLRALSSGSLLVAVQPEQALPLLQHLHRQNIPAADVGLLTVEKQYILLTKGLRYPLLAQSRDEITRIDANGA